MMGRAIQFRISQLAKWRQQFPVHEGIEPHDRPAAGRTFSSPFALEEPYTLMHQEKIDDSAALEILFGSDAWYQL